MNDRESSLVKTFAVPAVIAALSSVGLVAALIGDGALDFLSWLGLGAPIVAVLWALTQRRA